MKNVNFRTLMLKGKDGATINSIEKLEAEGGVMKMRIHLSDGTHVDFDVNDVPDTDLINNLIGIAIEPINEEIDKLETVFPILILPSDWSGSGPEYTATITKSGVTGNDEFEIIGFAPGNDTAASAEIKKNLGYIVYGRAGTDMLTFYAYGKKPSVSMTIRLRKVVSNY